MLAGLRAGAVVDKGYAEKHGLEVGGTLAMQTPDGTKQTLAVRGIYKVQAEQVLGGVVIDRATFDRAFPQPRDGHTFVKAEPGGRRPPCSRRSRGSPTRSSTRRRRTSTPPRRISTRR